MNPYFSKAGQFVLIAGLLVSLLVGSTRGQTAASLGIQTYAGLTITGAVGTVYSIQYTTNLTQTNAWTELTNVTLQSSPFLWLDTTVPTTGERFYRAVEATNQVSMLVRTESFSTGDGLGTNLRVGAATLISKPASADRLPAMVRTRAADLLIISATYGSGTHYSDVTDRVIDLLRQPGVDFFARPKWLSADPTPGWNKALVIIYEVNGHKHTFTTGEGGRVNASVLLDADN